MRGKCTKLPLLPFWGTAQPAQQQVKGSSVRVAMGPQNEAVAKLQEEEDMASENVLSTRRVRR